MKFTRKKKKKKSKVSDEFETEFSAGTVDVPTSGAAISEEDEASVAEALSMEVPLLLEQASRIHAAMKTWTEKTADLKGDYLKLCLARDIALGTAKTKARIALSQEIARPSNDLVEARALKDQDYRDLAMECIDSETQWQRARGIIQSLTTKKDMAKAMLYAMGEEAKLAEKFGLSAKDDEYR